MEGLVEFHLSLNSIFSKPLSSLHECLKFNLTTEVGGK